MKTTATKLFSLILLAAPAIFAEPVDWSFNNLIFHQVGFSDFGVTGDFTFDADTGTYSDANTVFHFQFGSAPVGLSFVSGDANSATWTSLFSGAVTFDWAAPLTDGGGTVDIASAAFDAGEVANAGASVSAPVATPEPSTVFLFALGLPALLLIRRRAITSAARSASRR